MKRADMGLWVEEVYISLLNIARIIEKLGHSFNNVIQSYMAAYEALPTRVEALYDAIKYCRLNNRFNQGYILAKHALIVPYDINSLFGEKWIYDYGVMDEFAIAAFYVEQYEECRDACLSLLNVNLIPLDYIERIKTNLEFAYAKISEFETK